MTVFLSFSPACAAARRSRDTTPGEIPSSRPLHASRNPTFAPPRIGFPRIAALLTLPILAATSGCATTQPWERELLAKRVMAPDEDPDDAALRAHYFGTREGAVGSLGGGGGGCGCN